MEGRSTQSVREIVLIDKWPKRVFIEPDKPGIHYFYWDLDLYKPFDYEPIALLGSNVLSRYHWRGLVIWNAPLKLEGKPLASFLFGVHTPIVPSKKWIISVIYCVKEVSRGEVLYRFLSNGP